MFTFVDGSCIHHRRLNASREVFFFLTIFPRRFSFLLNSSPFFLHDPSPSSNLYCLNHTFLFFFFPLFFPHPARPSAKKAMTTPPTKPRDYAPMRDQGGRSFPRNQAIQLLGFLPPFSNPPLPPHQTQFFSSGSSPAASPTFHPTPIPPTRKGSMPP